MQPFFVTLSNWVPRGIVSKYIYAEETRPVHAVIFDIDGTLLHSNRIDDETYLGALTDVLGQMTLRDSWGLYRNFTATGILLEILNDNQIPVSDAVIHSVREAFVARIASHIKDHGPIPQLAGATSYVLERSQSKHHQVAYATGGWRTSAAMKLQTAGFPVDDIPLATSDDHIERTAIMVHALNQLQGPFETITYYGDGEWDKSASAALGWQFQPVGEKLNGIRDFGVSPPAHDL